MTKKPKYRRSSQWRRVRMEFLAGKVCAVCHGTKKLEAHHIIPVHVDPSRELDPTNLIPLCEGNRVVNCHLTFGHLLSYRRYNAHVRLMVKAFRAGIEAYGSVLTDTQ